MSKNLRLEDGSVIKWFERSHKDFLNKTSLVYGRTQSGKSTIVIEIMYILKDYISAAFVVSQSNAADFIGKIPKHCIRRSITREWLETFLNIQKGRADLYNKANDIRTLKSLFERIKTPQTEGMEREIIRVADKYMHQVECDQNSDFAIKKEKIKEIRETQVKKLVELYKSNIRIKKHMLNNMTKSLTREEICCLNYLDFNPNVLLIFDDCASIFKKWVKESTVIKEIFYAGRWAYITFIITSQDDKEIESELRKNAIVSFFTTSQAAIANFTRASNAYPKHEKLRADLCTKRIFRNTDENGIPSKSKNFKKLVYIQNQEDPFMYIIADLYGDFKMGAQSLWDLDKKIEEKKSGSTNEETHGFFDRYYQG